MKNNLRDLRKAKGLTLEKLAEMVGVEKATISRHENGQRGLTLEFIKKYAKALNCTPAEIIETQIDSEEAILIQYFRHMSEADKDHLIKTAERLSRPEK